jgi:hypothetical protein
VNFSPQRKRTGKCFKCGKPTVLLIHQDCGRDAKTSTAKKRDSHYAGKLPKWMYS